MTVELIDSKETWDKFVDESPYGLVYHKWDFLTIVEKYTNYKFCPYGVFRGETLIGIFPLFRKKIAVINTIFSPPPRSGIPYLGFLTNPEYESLKQNKKETYLNQIVEEVNEVISSFTPNYISISIVPNFIDIRPFKWQDYTIDTHFTYSLDLSANLDTIWMDLKKETRKQIKSAESSGLKLTKSKDVTTFYNAMSERYKEQGLNFPLINQSYVEDLIATFPDQIGIYYVYDENDIPVSVQLTQEYKRFISWIGGSRTERPVHGNEYMQWNLIKLAKENNFHTFELSGAGLKRLCEFKSKFNPSLEVCYRVHKRDIYGKLAGLAYTSFIKQRWS